MRHRTYLICEWPHVIYAPPYLLDMWMTTCHLCATVLTWYANYHMASMCHRTYLICEWPHGIYVPPYLLDMWMTTWHLCATVLTWYVNDEENRRNTLEDVLLYWGLYEEKGPWRMRNRPSTRSVRNCITGIEVEIGQSISQWIIQSINQKFIDQWIL